jgi:drug/metabolite transporter (DMT)-like permease
MIQSTRREHVIAVWSALLVTVLWSSSWVLIRFGLDDEALPPITFAGLRYGLAAVVLMSLTLARPTTRDSLRQLQRHDLVVLAGLGFVFYTFTQGAQFVAIKYQPAATTSLVLSMTPLLVAAASARSLGERPVRRQYVGAALVAGGALVYFAGDLGATALGLTAALVALGANTASALLGRYANRGHSTPPLVITAVTMSVGATLLVLSGLVLDGWPEVSTRAAVLIVWLALVNTAAAFTLWNASLRHLSAVESSGLNNTMLIQIGVLAWIFLDEPLGVLGTAAVIIVSIGIALTRSERPTP